MFRIRSFMEKNTYTEAQVDLMNEFNLLWLQYVYWTRLFLISDINDLDDVQAVTNRLLRNPKDFALVFRRYYGLEKANQFENLLTQHLVLAAQLVDAAKAGNTNSVNDIRKKWYKNADDIANFLSQINPYWSESEWKKMLYEHEKEATQLLTKEYVMSIATFDEIEKQALTMANNMAMGIIKQFRV